MNRSTQLVGLALLTLNAHSISFADIKVCETTEHWGEDCEVIVGKDSCNEFTAPISANNSQRTNEIAENTTTAKVPASISLDGAVIDVGVTPIDPVVPPVITGPEVIDGFTVANITNCTPCDDQNPCPVTSKKIKNVHQKIMAERYQVSVTQ